MEFNEALEKLQGNPEVVASLKAAFDRGATTDEVAAILADAGLAAEGAEPLLAEYQRNRGAAIAVQELDDEELEQVAGGGDGVNCNSSVDCDKNFKDSRFFDLKHCEYDAYCDEYFQTIHRGGKL